jgi:hypothetical protein
LPLFGAILSSARLNASPFSADDTLEGFVGPLLIFHTKRLAVVISEVKFCKAAAQMVVPRIWRSHRSPLRRSRGLQQIDMDYEIGQELLRVLKRTGRLP